MLEQYPFDKKYVYIRIYINEECDTVPLGCYGYQIKYENISVKILKKWLKAAFELLLVLFFDRLSIVF